MVVNRCLNLENVYDIIYVEREKKTKNKGFMLGAFTETVSNLVHMFQ